LVREYEKSIIKNIIEEKEKKRREEERETYESPHQNDEEN